MTDQQSKYFAAQNRHPHEPGIVIENPEACENFIEKNGTIAFASQYTYKVKRLYIIKIEQWLKKQIRNLKRQNFTKILFSKKFLQKST